MAAAVVAPIVPAAVLSAAFDLHLDGRPDLKNPAVVSSLPPNPQVRLTDIDHHLIKATPCFGWAKVPGASPADPPIAMSFSLSHLTLLCTIGGYGTPWLTAQANALLLSHVPSHANNMWTAWVVVGGLDLDCVYDTIPKLVDAVLQAKLASGGDNRLMLIEDAFFSNENRPLAGAGSAVDRSWMYCFSGDTLLSENPAETRALAYLRLAVEPKDKSDKRDLAGDNYCRILMALKRITEARSEFVAAACQDPATPVDEIAEYVAEQWKQMVGTGFPFILEGKLVQRNRELGLADSLLHGTEADKEATFRKMISELVSSSRLVRKCIEDGSGCQSQSSLAANFEQLANEVLPGVKWCSLHCVQAVEHELTVLKLESLLDSWGDSPLEILSSLRSHLKQERSACDANSKIKAGSIEEIDRGLTSASGIEAKKLSAFLDTKRRVAGCSNFMAVLDALLATDSKPWYMKAIRKLTLASQNVAEMESCSKYLEEWAHYWPMAISRDDQGVVDSDVQGKRFPEDQVELLLDGQWHKIQWLKLVQMQELWTDNVQPDDGSFHGTFANLHGIKDFMFKTMKLIKLARNGESESSLCTCTGFMNKIIRLERRSRGLPKGTPARQQAVDNMVQAMRQGLSEFGARWVQQFAKPVNYTEPLQRSFADSHCFVMLRIDELDKVADDLHDWAKVLPTIFEGGTFKVNEGRSPRQKHSGLKEESLSQGGLSVSR